MSERSASAYRTSSFRFCRDYRTTADYLVQTGATERNYEKWPGISFSYDSEIDDMINFLDECLNWIDAEISDL